MLYQNLTVPSTTTIKNPKQNFPLESPWVTFETIWVHFHCKSSLGHHRGIAEVKIMFKSCKVAQIGPKNINISNNTITNGIAQTSNSNSFVLLCVQPSKSRYPRSAKGTKAWKDSFCQYLVSRKYQSDSSIWLRQNFLSTEFCVASNIWGGFATSTVRRVNTKKIW